MDKQTQPESIPYLAKLYNRTHGALYRAIERGRLQVWRSDSLTWSTRAAVEKYLASDRRKKENRMSVQEKIQERITQAYQDSSPNVYKGNDYDGAIQAYGWWYKPFNATPIFLGASLAEALEMLDQVAEGDLL